MRRLELTPFFRSSIGFDRLLNQLEGVARAGDVSTYPPYNIEKTGEDTYRLTMAVAGFSQEDLGIEVEDSLLTVTGSKDKDDEVEHRYLHRGIAERVFERRFNLADYMQVVGADLENGLLHIELRRELPEAMKPRTIEIAGNSQEKVITREAA